MMKRSPRTTLRSCTCWVRLAIAVFTLCGTGSVGKAEEETVIRVFQRANQDGSLLQMQLGRRKLGNDESAFGVLNAEILTIIGRPGHPLTKDIVIELTCDYQLHFRHVVRAIEACTGYIDPKSQKFVHYGLKITFAPYLARCRLLDRNRVQDGKDSELVFQIGYDRKGLIRSGPYVFHNGEKVLIEKSRLTVTRAWMKAKKSPSDLTLVLIADDDTPIGKVEELIEICQKEGFQQFALLSMQPK